MDTFTELHIISDLHLGGLPGSQVFSAASGAALAWFIGTLTASAASRRIGLVINGDFVDFLATEGAAAFNPDRAVIALQALESDDVFAQVVVALRTFIRTPSRVLTIVLGNHDIELALPHVQSRLIALLCQEDDAARGRLRLVFDGTGYACEVGGRRVLCVHGNEVDNWNYVDQAALRAQIAAYNQCASSNPTWAPCAGSVLVADVLNEVKKEHPFVDLLKPEREPVLLTLRHLGESVAQRLHRLPALVWGYGRGAGKRHGILGAEVSERSPLRRDLARNAAVTADWPGLPFTPDPTTELARVDQSFRRGLDPMSFVQEGTLSWWDSVVRFTRTRGDPRNLREALQLCLVRDDTFVIDAEDDTFQALDEAVAPEVDFLVAGHTHLARRIRRRNGGGLYLNSGTWIRLIEIPAWALCSDAAFEPVRQGLTAKSLAELDAVVLADGKHLVSDRRTVVSITDHGERGVFGKLRQVEGTTATGFHLNPPADQVL